MVRAVPGRYQTGTHQLQWMQIGWGKILLLWKHVQNSQMLPIKSRRELCCLWWLYMWYPGKFYKIGSGIGKGSWETLCGWGSVHAKYLRLLKSNPKYIKKNEFVFQCDQILLENHIIRILKKYGNLFKAITAGKFKPRIQAQKRFLEVHKGLSVPSTEPE